MAQAHLLPAGALLSSSWRRHIFLEKMQMFLQYPWVQLCPSLPHHQPPASARRFCRHISSRLLRGWGLGWGQAGAGVDHQHCPGQSKGRQKPAEPCFQGQRTVQNTSLTSDVFFL